MAKETTSDLKLIKQLEREVGRKLPQKDYKTLMEWAEPGLALATGEGGIQVFESKTFQRMKDFFTR